MDYNTTIILAELRQNPQLLAELRTLLNASNTQHRDKEIVSKVWGGESRVSVAKQYNISVGRVHQIMAENPNPDGKVQRHKQRNDLILDRLANNASRREVAKEFGLSLTRVNQIAGKSTKARPNANPNAQIEEALRKFDAFEPLTTQDISWVLALRYEAVARRIAEDMINGASQYTLETRYNKILEPELSLGMANYVAVFDWFVDHTTHTWKR